MTVSLFARAGYPVGPIVVAGFCAFLAVTFRLTRTRTDQGSTRDCSPRNRGAMLGCVSLLCGPTIGVVLGLLACHFQEIDPLDVGHTYGAFVGVGSFVGILGGVAFAVASLFAGKSSAKTGGHVDPDL